MSTAQEVVRAGTAAGANLFADGDKLSVTAPRPLPDELVEALRRSKAEILHLLSADGVDDDLRLPALDLQWWHDFFNERAAHREFDGGYSRVDAERLVFGEMILEWHRRYSAPRDPHRCAGCGDDLVGENILALCDGARVHFDGVRGVNCITTYGKKWRGSAVAALRAIGLVPPPGFDSLL
jgi:hypothetical protein